MLSERKKDGSGYRLLGSILREIRQEKKLTMRDVAEIAGIPHSFVGKIENAERRLDIVEFVRYCRILGADPGRVFDLFRQKANIEV